MSVLFEQISSDLFHVIILEHKHDIKIYPIVVISTEYPFNTITDLELKGYKVKSETTAEHIKVMG